MRHPGASRCASRSAEGPFLFAALLIAVVWLLWPGDSAEIPPPGDMPAVDTSGRPLRITPPTITLARSQNDSRGHREASFELTNQADERVRIERIMTSCGCTVVNLVGDRELSPG